MKKFFEKLFGRKYYFVVARNRFSLTEFCAGHIFASFDEAYDFCVNLEYETRTNVGLEVHSFRSHKNITTYDKEK